MLQVKILTKKDYNFAVELANTMNWNMAAEDFEFNASLEQDGCLLLIDGKERLGIATCISYGKIGWFGNLIVREDYRKRGGGSILVKHAINYLQKKGVETIGLYAYPNLQGFYEKMGFKFNMDFTILAAEHLEPATPETIPKIGRRQFQGIVEFDSQYFGAKREGLLKSIILQRGNASYYVSEGKEVMGYVAATIYESMAWVGPLICKPNRHDVAASLIKSVFSDIGKRSVYAVVSKTDIPLLEVFSSFGFREEFFVSRMFLGKATAKNCIYIAESLERG
ncbi:MAG TPA: GNAT family N-acetyltransferase [Candidatus Nanoarchaeia archaeon]|nr:GNAT family N-acetyltransferase [Candidatus Nanoarchaeia archaeon]